MRVVVEVGNAPGSSSSSGANLDSALVQQFAEIQKKLMGLIDAQGSRDKELVNSLKSQQTDLISALENLMGKVGSDSGGSDELLKAVRGVKRNVSVSMPKELLERFDSMEAAIANGMKKSRNRTFGSNY